MQNCLRGFHSGLTILAMLIPVLMFGQPAVTETLKKEDAQKRNSLSIELTPSVLPGAIITRTQGNYTLRSRLQSSYDLGLNYQYAIDQRWNFITGFHFVLGKWNNYANIPTADLSMFGITDGRSVIENKELWGSFRIPLLIERKFETKKYRIFSVKAGTTIRYSGLVTDTRFGGSFIGPNGQQYQFYTADMYASKRPWLTFIAGGFRQFRLRNNNILSAGIQADLSNTWFYKGPYEITIPNQPVTRGEYIISGTSLGLAITYNFTGSNKQVVRKYLQKTAVKKKAQVEEVLTRFVFKNNHLSFRIHGLSVLRARLKRTAGDYPVHTTATAGAGLGFMCHVNFNNTWSLVFGPEADLIGRDMIVSFSKNDFNPPLTTDYRFRPMDSYFPDLILSLPVMMERRWIYAKKKLLFADAGLRLNFSTGADFETFSFSLQSTGNSYYQAGGWDVNANNDAKPWLSIPLYAGHAWLLRNNNLLQLAASASISFTKYVSGTYWVDVPGRTYTTGTYKSSGSYIGITLGYVFTNANNRIRKVLEKK